MYSGTNGSPEAKKKLTYPVWESGVASTFICSDVSVAAEVWLEVGAW